jgi:hypothetical protein
MRLARIRRVHKRHEHGAKLLEIDRLGKVAVETGLDAFLVDVAKDVGREGNDGLVLLLGALFPAAEFFTCLVAVFVGHVEVALDDECKLVSERIWGVSIHVLMRRNLPG